MGDLDMMKLTGPQLRLRDSVEVTHESRRLIFVTVPTAIVGVDDGLLPR